MIYTNIITVDERVLNNLKFYCNFQAAAMPSSQSTKPSAADDEDMDPTVLSLIHLTFIAIF